MYWGVLNWKHVVHDNEVFTEALIMCSYAVHAIVIATYILCVWTFKTRRTWVCVVRKILWWGWMSSREKKYPSGPRRVYYNETCWCDVNFWVNSAGLGRELMKDQISIRNRLCGWCFSGLHLAESANVFLVFLNFNEDWL